MENEEQYEVARDRHLWITSRLYETSAKQVSPEALEGAKFNS